MKSTAATTACCFVVSCLLCTVVSAQKNLVQNPGFEAVAPGKKAGSDNPIDVATGWSAPNMGKSLLYTTRGDYIYDPHGSLWPFKARTGKNVAGMNVYGDDDGILRREYIQGTMTQPLTVGRKYFFEFWVHYHCEGANNIGIAFLPEKIKDTTTGLLNFQPVSFQKKVTPYDIGANAWTLVRDSFVAVRPFQYFIIGNFFPDSLTLIEGNTYDHHFAYIDDILVVEAPNQPAATPAITKEEEKKWAENVETSKGMTTQSAGNIATAARVFFKFDSAEITPEAATLLDGIVVQLSQQTGAKVELKGFASSEGSTAYNQELSRRRNQSVQQYLAAKGIAASVITMIAFGEENPAAPNDTE
ncbi:MAG TPA: OmpA family protein, partial [Saprospiraceae bacterium]|nr:OmpA family protein [Saprospiraceae bacterium]